MPRNDTPGKGWIDLCSDMSWEDYHGMWGKKAPDGSWYVLKWTNMLDACDERDCREMGYVWECAVKRVDLTDIPDDEIASVLRSCGWKIIGDQIVNEHDGSPVVSAEHREACLVECCITYGLGAPLESFTDATLDDEDEVQCEHDAEDLREEARAYAESLMGDSKALDDRLARPVNAIGPPLEE